MWSHVKCVQPHFVGVVGSLLARSLSVLPVDSKYDQSFLFTNGWIA